MSYGHGWPFCESVDGYDAEARDDHDADEDARWTREDRLADFAPAAPIALALDRMASNLAAPPCCATCGDR